MHRIQYNVLHKFVDLVLISQRSQTGEEHTGLIPASKNRKMASSTGISPEQNGILSMMQGLWQNRCLGIAVGFHIPEILCNSEEASTAIDDIAKRLECKSSKNIYTLMSILAKWGIGTELEGKRFAKNNAMELLRRDKGPSLGHFVAHHCSDEILSAMRSMPECIKSGQPAFLIEHGMNHIDYMNKVEERPSDKQNMFHTWMSENPVSSSERRKEFAENYNQAVDFYNDLFILERAKGVQTLYTVFPWSSCHKIADVGGCTGHFLASILKLPACEHVQGCVVDLPHVIDDALKNSERNGIPKSRIQFIKHDFSEPFPSERRLEVDTVIIKNVISMFVGRLELTIKFLRNCRGLLPEQGGRVVIIEYAECGDKIGLNGLQQGWYDMHMLNIAGISITSGADWDAMMRDAASQAGYQFQRAYDTFAGGLSIFELSCD